jgi:putative membrane protein
MKAEVPGPPTVISSPILKVIVIFRIHDGCDRYNASPILCETPVGMIERYSDHAANERTFLAWVRTAIAVMAFGFLVQKFDLFLKIASASRTARSLPERSHVVGDIAGLLLIVLGGAMMVLAAIRFRKTALDIDAREMRPGPGTLLDITLATMLFLLGAILFVYLSYTVISTL